MEISRYNKQNRLHKAASSEYEASQARAQQIRPSGQEPRSGHIDKNQHRLIKGEIIDLRYQEVKIRLEPSDQIITAKLSSDVPLSIGQTAEFMVSDEIDGQITLRYISTASTSNIDIIHKALYASGLMPSERNLAIVQELLNYQMPVDKYTILQLIKLTSTYPDVNLATLLVMQKNNLPINVVNVAQFEAYQKGSHQILSQLKSLTSDISLALNYEFVNDINSNQPSTVAGSSSDSTIHNPIIFTERDINTVDSTYSRNNIHAQDTIELYKEILTLLKDGESPLTQVDPNTVIDHVFSTNHLKEVEDILLSKFEETSYTSPDTIEDNKLQLSSGSMTLKDLLLHLHELYIRDPSQKPLVNVTLPFPMLEAFLGMSDYLLDTDKDKLMDILGSDIAHATITESLHTRWTLTPEELTDKNKVRDFFIGLDDDLEHIKELAVSTKLLDLQSIKDSTIKLQDNLQFMKDLNELFAYLQLPMRLTEQNVHGELYVFTRKHKKHQDTEKLNVLLHLDMANLGPIDIHLSIIKKQVNAVFYLNESSEQIITNHLHELTRTLSDKGYNLQAKAKISHSKPDFIRDILEQDTPSPNTHRYSFDIRA